MSIDSIKSLTRLTDALLSFYETTDQKNILLKQIDSLSEYLTKERDIWHFLGDYGFSRENKKEVLDEMGRGLGLDEFFSNSLFILADNYLISKVELYLSTLRTRLFRELNIKNVYVYSSFPIDKKQSQKLEKLWRDRLNMECYFYYAIDKTLRLGIKVQVDMYIEEYSLSSKLNNLKIKLDSLLD